MSKKHWCQGFCTLCGTGCAQYCEEIDALRAELNKWKDGYADIFAENEALKRIAEAARGFKEHGVAKNGTHAQILFKALAAWEDRG